MDIDRQNKLQSILPVSVSESLLPISRVVAPLVVTWHRVSPLMCNQIALIAS